MTERLVILQGVVGSTAYGLAHAESDQDQLGIYTATLADHFGLYPPNDNNSSHVSTDPDVTLHELAKFARMVLKCNPTAMELLWLDSYTVFHPAAQLLIDVRTDFLSHKYVRDSYSGYVRQQASRLMQRNGEGRKGFDPDLAKRTAKHGRHCYRLLIQGKRLLSGEGLLINVSEYRDEIFRMGHLAENDPQVFYDRVMQEVAVFDEMPEVLPCQPNKDKIETALVQLKETLLLDSRFTVGSPTGAA